MTIYGIWIICNRIDQKKNKILDWSYYIDLLLFIWVGGRGC